MKCWFVVPAAGTGSRFGGAIPKQYSMLNGKTIVEHTLDKLLSLDGAGVVVALNPEDQCWQQLDVFKRSDVHRVAGGEERADSVLAALRYLEGRVSGDDWVLVHDVARPCVQPADVRRLIRAVGTDLNSSNGGAILAAPVSDTLKQADDNQCIQGTRDRQNLWAAMTPQMFPYNLLRNALEKAMAQNVRITDEAMAVELAGYKPKLVAGCRDNIKVTHAEDLAIAETILRWQENHNA